MQIDLGRIVRSIALILCGFPAAHAQDTLGVEVAVLDTIPKRQLIGIRAGYNVTNITSRDFDDRKTDDREGFSMGLTYDRFIRPGVTLGAALLYEQRGFRGRVVFTDAMGVETGEYQVSEFNYDYLDMPVRIGVFIGDRIHAFGNIGVVPALLMAARTTVPIVNVSGEFQGRQTVNVTYSASSLDFSGIAELGAGAYVHDRLLLSLSGSFQHSVLSISNVGYFSQSLMWNRGVNISTGIRYVLVR